jgi:hypothetical protein
MILSLWSKSMARKRKEIKEWQIERPERAQLSAEESLKRMQDFAQRKERFVAAVRKGKNRSVSP